MKINTILRLKVKVELSFFYDTIVFISGGDMTKLSVDRNKLSQTIKDALIHKKYFSLVCVFLLDSLDFSINKNQLAKNFENHDNSKLENLLEFVALASIIDSRKDMANINNQLLEAQRRMISFHWLSNPHHHEYHMIVEPEDYQLQSGIDVLYLIETACDLQARAVQMQNSALEFLDVQQEMRYHYSKEKFDILKGYLQTLVKAMDGVIVPQKFDLDDLFVSNDPVVKGLLRLPNIDFVDKLTVSCLELEKSNMQDFFGVTYIVRDRNTKKEIGEITLYCNNKLYYSVPKEYERDLLTGVKELISGSSIEVGSINALELMDEQLFDYQEGQGVLTYSINKGNLS